MRFSWWYSLGVATLAAGCSSPRPPAPPPPRPLPPDVERPTPPPAPAKADLILTNAAIRTLDPAAPLATTIAIRNGTIAAIGGAEIAGAWQGATTRIVDLAGAAVAPALADHHVHVFNVGYSLLNEHDPDRMFLDLAPATAYRDVGNGVKLRSSPVPRGQWVLGTGWSEIQWGARTLPTHDLLTLSAPNHPVYLSRVDGQTGWANRRALEAAGLWAPGPDPVGGRVVRNRDGRPTGILLGRANEPLVALLPPLADSDIVRAYRLGAEELAGRGIARAYDAGVLAAPGIVALNLDFGRYAGLLARADLAEPLPLELSLMIPAPSAFADSVLGWDPARHQLSPRVRITHLKFFVDGALGSRSAALTHPYADDPSTTGLLRMTTPEIVTLAGRALDRNLGVATHAIGDGAVTRVLDAYEELLRTRPGLDSRRLRIEHFSYASESDMQRAVRLGIVLSVHSNFNAHPGDNSGFELARVGAANADRVYAWDRLARMGARLAEGSDYFTRPTTDALHQVAATMTRTNTVGAAYPDSAARVVAWKMNATWYPAAGPAIEPTLRAGSVADLVVLQRDPFAVPRDRFETTRVVATLRAGAFTWQSFGFRSRHGDDARSKERHTQAF